MATDSMQPLAPCHSRHELTGVAGRYFCAHPNVWATNHVVSYEFCRICPRWRELPPDNPRTMPPRLVERLSGGCCHLGEEIGTRPCSGCLGNVRVKVFACRHPNHRETTLKECEVCGDFDQSLSASGS